MFTIAADYLMGWSMAAADGARKQHAEWPPHPDRLFMALAAAWFETGANDAEGRALRWLESLPPPALAASAAEARLPVAHYVPVNDTSQASSKSVRALAVSPEFPLDKARDAGLAQLPQWRARQPRSFPVTIPHDPVVRFIWEVKLPDEHREPLEILCGKVSCLGHSASLVRTWVDETSPAPSWIPGDGVGAARFRISAVGRLDYLRQRFNRDEMLAHAAMQSAVDQAKGQARQRLKQEMAARFPDAPVSLRPEPALWQAYVRPLAVAQAHDVSRSVFDDRLIVLGLAGQRLGLPATLTLTAALRGALLRNCAGTSPEWFTGHGESGDPSRQPHLALFPLPFTGSSHADGRLMGVALALPRGLPADSAARSLGPLLHGDDGLPRELHLFDGRALDCTAVLESRENPPLTLRAGTWAGPARRWATVTPIVLDRHQDGPDRWERAASVVADACLRIGLPRPVDVLLHPNSLLEGVPPSHRFEPLTRKHGGGRLAHTHAVISFDVDVLGPVAVGAGRFRGYGLCRPLRAGGDHG